MAKTRRIFWFRPWLIATVLCLVYAFAVVAKEGDSLALVTIGGDLKPAEIDYAYSDEGYDGQFVYYIARYGVTPETPLDIPAYRAQRILLPALGSLFSFGQVALVPWMLLAINVIVLASSTYVLEQILVEFKVSRWYAVGFALSIGMLGAARLSTTETLAYGLVVYGIYTAQKDKLAFSTLFFALAALSKETALIFPAVYSLYLLYQRKISRAILLGAGVLLPFVLWQLYLYGQFGTFGIGSGGGGATSFEVIPFMGIIRILTEGGPSIFLILMLVIGPFVLWPVAWGLWRSWQDYQNKQWTFYTLLLFANSALMLFIPFSTYREMLGILRFIVGLQIAVILYAAQRRQHRVLRYSTFWMMTTLLIVMSDFSAGI